MNIGCRLEQTRSHSERPRNIPWRPVFLVLSLAAAFFASSVFAQGVTIGGYDVAKIASATIDALNAKKVVTDAEAKGYRSAIASIHSDDPLVSAAPVVAVYDKIFAGLVDSGVATKDDIAAVMKTAAESGGLKIGGLNPVVLAASCLDLIARKGIVSLPEAQSILDSAKSVKKR